MADIIKKQVDAVLVGFGWTGAIMGMELTEAGLNVVALERGENRDTYPDFAYPRIADELTYGIRGKLFQNLSRETLTIRHSPGTARALSTTGLVSSRNRGRRRRRTLERSALAGPARGVAS
jgi:choline dehydrogenase-like flavoprotein